MKTFPRLHSLHAINLRHHQEFNYDFHPLRTDFIGESGSGKSIVADLLQLIFVGPTAYRSATQSLDDERPPKTLLIPGESTGYAFLNIEVYEGAYVVVGVQIENVHHGVRLFTIQEGFAWDEQSRLNPFTKSLNVADFFLEKSVLPLNELANHLGKRGLFVKQFLSTRAYHALLYRSELLPIDLASSERALKTYASIIQAFSRRKSLDPKKSKELIEFLFGSEKAQEHYRSYEGLIRAVVRDDDDYALNRKELDRIKEKEVVLKSLHDKQQIYLDSKRIYYLVRLQDAFEQRQLSRRRLFDAFEHYNVSTQTMKHWQAYCQEQHEAFTKQLEPLEVTAGITLDEFSTKKQPFQRVQRVTDWLKDCNVNIDQLPQFFKEYKEAKANEALCDKVRAVFTSQQQWMAFEESAWINGWESGNDWTSAKLAELEKNKEEKKILLDFSDVKESATLCYWGYHSEDEFDEYDVAVFVGLMPLYLGKPAMASTGHRYLPNPNELFKCLTQLITEEDTNGFRLHFAGIREYFEFRKDLMSALSLPNSRRAFLKKQSDDSEKEVNKIESDIREIKLLKRQIDGLGDQKIIILNAYKHRNKLNQFNLYDPFDISQEEFDSCYTCYTDIDLITQAHTNAEAVYKTALKSLQDCQTNLFRSKEQTTDYNQLFIPYVGTAETVEKYIREHADEFVQPVWSVPKTDFSFDINYQSSRSSFRLGQSAFLLLEEWENLRQAYQKARGHFQLIENEYEALYGKIPSLPIEQQLGGLEQHHQMYRDAEAKYKSEYEQIVRMFLRDSAHELEDVYEYVTLIRYLFPKLLDEQSISEEIALERITHRLNEILNHLRSLNRRNLTRISDLMGAVVEDRREIWSNVRRLERFFEDPKHFITGGHRVKLIIRESETFPIQWIHNFRRDLAISPDFADQFINQVTFEEKLKAAFISCSGLRNIDYDNLDWLKIRDLLNPNSYQDLLFNMVSSDSGETNVGSTGQTYAAMALLCIARLSLIGRSQRKGIRFMPIDEAEGLGSNYDMLHDIARTNDYQLISLSINLVGPFKEGEQYVYMLQRDLNSKYPVNYTPYPIFSEPDLDQFTQDTNEDIVEDYSLPLDHRYNFSWPHYRALRQLYEKGHTNLTIDNNPYIKERLISEWQWIQPKLRSEKGYEIPKYLQLLYNDWYEEFCQQRVDQYQQFFREYNIPDEGIHPYKEEDIWSMMVIASQKENILDDFDKYSLNNFSEEFFKGKGAKYLGNSPSLLKAVKIILDTAANFPGEDKKDNQWRLAVECDEADTLVLCENVNFLRLPKTARKLHVDLWSIGGNNISAIDLIPDHKIQLPLYYACDWDHAGLQIFSRIKAKLAAKGFSIQLLYPSATPDKYLLVNSPNHFSEWARDKPLSGLRPDDFSVEERQLIQHLVQGNQWIEEESNDLGMMLERFRNLEE